ncbi:21561_t:CDS:2, partial [Gigaspora rosea]
KGEMLNQDQKANRVLIEREEYKNLANNCYGKRTRNNEWDLKKSEDRSRRVDEEDNLEKNQLEEAVNTKWDEISEAIVQAANKNIPYIKVRKTDVHFKKAMPKLEIYKEISFLYQIIKKFKRLAVDEIESELQSEYNSQIFLLNMKYETEILLIKHNWSLVVWSSKENKETGLGKIHKKGKVWAEVEVSDLCKVPDENGNYRSKQLEGSSKRLHIPRKALGDVTNIIGKGKVNANKLECLE